MVKNVDPNEHEHTCGPDCSAPEVLYEIAMKAHDNDEYSVVFKVRHQSFELAFRGTEEEAQWFGTQLNTALLTLVKEEPRGALVVGLGKS